MPLINLKQQDFPKWSEIKFYKIEHLSRDNSKIFEKISPKLVLFIVEGQGWIKFSGEKILVKEGDFLPVNFDKYRIAPMSSYVRFVTIGGDWGSETGTCGVFQLSTNPDPINRGDPVNYNRNTRFDNHFHDCDEYWIIVKGKGKAVSEGKFYNLEPGICIATKRGQHHDIPWIEKTLLGVWFETTLYGKKRRGHLYQKI